MPSQQQLIANAIERHREVTQDIESQEPFNFRWRIREIVNRRVDISHLRISNLDGGNREHIGLDRAPGGVHRHGGRAALRPEAEVPSDGERENRMRGAGVENHLGWSRPVHLDCNHIQ